MLSSKGLIEDINASQSGKLINVIGIRNTFKVSNSSCKCINLGKLGFQKITIIIFAKSVNTHR